MSIKEYVISHIVNLIKIKSLVTLATTATFVILALRGDIKPDQFLVIFTTITGFYFGSQTKKDETADTKEEEKPEEKQVATVYPMNIQYDAVYKPTTEYAETGEVNGTD